MPAQFRQAGPLAASKTMQRSVLLGAAIVCIVVALLLPQLTIAGYDYRTVMRCALYVACIGNLCLMGLIWIGTGWWRLAGIGLMAPTMWVVLGAQQPNILFGH
jgi:hypothetical protein